MLQIVATTQPNETSSVDLGEPLRELLLSHAQVASAIGSPKTARAVGLAVSVNPVAFMIPYHRVIQQNGKLGGYHWGETRKQAIHAREEVRYSHYALSDEGNRACMTAKQHTIRRLRPAVLKFQGG